MAAPVNAMPVKLDALPCTVNAPTNELIELMVGRLKPPTENVEPQIALATMDVDDVTREAASVARPAVMSISEILLKLVVSPLSAAVFTGKLSLLAA